MYGTLGIHGLTNCLLRKFTVPSQNNHKLWNIMVNYKDPDQRCTPKQYADMQSDQGICYIDSERVFDKCQNITLVYNLSMLNPFKHSVP